MQLIATSSLPYSICCSKSCTVISPTSPFLPAVAAISLQSINASTDSKKHEPMPKQCFGGARRKWPKTANHHESLRLETRSGSMPTKFKYIRQAESWVPSNLALTKSSRSSVTGTTGWNYRQHSRSTMYSTLIASHPGEAAKSTANYLCHQLL